MKYDFDTVIGRENTNSAKWDPAVLKARFGLEDGVLPLWVADMDFRVPQSIIEAITKRAEHGIFGYSAPLEEYFTALSWWQKTRHDWEIKQEWLSITPGVVPALNYFIRALSNEGDKIIIQQPVYYPFNNTIETNNRVVANNPLKLENGTYVMDFDNLEQVAKDPTAKALILCSPHNPMGVIWSEEDLRKLGEICNRNNVVVISDEIHNDLILPGYKHFTYALLGEEFANNAVICTAPSKTFNLAGLQTSNIIIPNKEIKDKIDRELKKSSVMFPNLFGIVATTAAYSEDGVEWLTQLLDYLDANTKFIEKFAAENMPKVKYSSPQGTYLGWLDFRELGLSQEDLESKITKDAKVFLDGGSWFGPGGEGFMRVNFACPRSILEEALNRIAKVMG
jgi:cysteine-S-conjugate beta-lyase